MISEKQYSGNSKCVESAKQCVGAVKCGSYVSVNRTVTAGPGERAERVAALIVLGKGLA